MPEELRAVTEDVLLLKFYSRWKMLQVPPVREERAVSEVASARRSGAFTLGGVQGAHAEKHTRPHSREKWLGSVSPPTKKSRWIGFPAGSEFKKQSILLICAKHIYLSCA